MPSGGVGLHNAGHYLEFEPVFAVSGSWMAPRHTIAAGDFTMIEKLSADAVALIRSDSA
jgi:2-dehydro-3-deoxyphosphogluconate aldolase/(4S)-4-hydroxy-2-oxoglutarate aldolase